MDNDITDNIKPQNIFLKKWKVKVLLVFVIIFIFGYYFLSAPFGNKDIIIHISSGQSVNSISQKLKYEKAIKKDYALKFFIKLLKSGNGIITGDYLIEKDSPVWVVAWQISRGHHKIEPIKVTIREGLTNEEITDLLFLKLSSFNKDIFLSKIQDKQGYLFPDTYFFFSQDTVDEIINKLSNNFESRIKKLSMEIDKSGKTLDEIIIMASILEGEAKGKEDSALISGILWKRISIGMPLQVDVDKSTYTSKGFPKNPLNNPGLLSIESAINPKYSSYLYYLHGNDGKVHFAGSFEEHKRNINNYLR